MLRYVVLLVMALGTFTAHSITPPEESEGYKETKGLGYFNMIFVNDKDCSRKVSVTVNAGADGKNYITHSYMEVEPKSTTTWVVRRPFIHKDGDYDQVGGYKAKNPEKRPEIEYSYVELLIIDSDGRKKATLRDRCSKTYVGDTLFVNIGDTHYPKIRK